MSKDSIPYTIKVCIIVGLRDDALDQIPSDVQLQRFSSGCDESTIQKLAIHLGMTLKEWEKLVTDYRWIDIVKYRILVNWREENSGRFSNLAKALTDMDVSTHTLCQVNYFDTLREQIKTARPLPLPPPWKSNGCCLA